MRRGVFVSGTGTGIGKTWLARGLVRRATQSGLRVAALKPIETGVQHTPEDALALGRAAGRAELAFAPGLGRFRLPVSPWAAVLEGEPALSFDGLVETVQELALGSDLVVVEGAGGLFVPIDAERTTADLALALDLGVLLVAPNRLGVLSDVLAHARAAEAKDVPLTAIVLTPAGDDPSTRTNARILGDRTGLPVHVVAPSEPDDDALAAMVDAAGLEEILGLGRPTDQ